jgi:hypothetical protein
MNELSRLALKIVVGAREQGTGNREQGTGNRKRVLGDFTFLHIPLNFSVHLLITCLVSSSLLLRSIYLVPSL